MPFGIYQNSLKVYYGLDNHLEAPHLIYIGNSKMHTGNLPGLLHAKCMITEQYF